MRASLRNAVQDRRGNAQPLVTVHVYEPGTTDEISATMFENPTGIDELSNPLTTDGNGEFAFFLDTPQQVDLVVVENTVTRTIPSVAVGSAEPVEGGGGGGWPQMSAATELTLDSNTDGAVTVTQDHHVIRTLGAAPTGELATINGSVDNKWLVLRADPAGAEEITITGAGNILPAESDRTTIQIVNFVRLWYNPDIAKWLAEDPARTVGLEAEDGSAAITAQSSAINVVSGILTQTSNTFNIADDRITDVAHNRIRVRPETGTADDLAGVEIIAAAGYAAGDVLYLSLRDSGDVITLKHDNAGGVAGSKLFMQGGADIVLAELQDFAVLVYSNGLDSGDGGWMVNASRQAVHVADGASVDDLRDALVAAGLMAAL